MSVTTGVVHDRDQSGGTELMCFPFETRDGSPRDCPHMARLLARFAKSYGVDCDDLVPAPHAGAISQEVTRRLAAAGYCVYDGDAYLALYPKGHCS